MMKPGYIPAGRVHLAWAGVAAVLASFASSAAHAQYALGDGRVLDANPRIGGDGTNDRRISPLREVALRNAVVTGNVGGGRQFRGEIGYTGAFDFRGETGSGELFANYVDSYYSGFASRGVRGINDLRSQFGFTSPSGTLVGTEVQVRRPQTGAFASETNAGFAATRPVGVDVFGAVNGTLRSTSSFALRTADSAEILGRERNDDGLLIVTAASPLLGVRDLREGSLLLGDNTRDRFDVLGLASTPGLGAVTDAAGAQAVSGSLIVPGISPVLTAAPDGAAPWRTANDDPAVLPENLVRPERPSSVAGREDLPDARVGVRIDNERIVSGLEGHREVLRQLREGAEAEGFVQPAESGGSGDAELDEFLRSVSELLENTNNAPSPAVPGTRLDGSDDGDERRVEPIGEDDAPELDPNNPEDRERLVRLLRRGRITMDGLAPGEGEADPVFIRHMTRGERWLLEGRWFDAEERFTAALSIDPSSASASIGRVNAQIGAGFYASAALNLRRMLRDYPELTAVVYDSELLPRGDRLADVREQLRRRMGQNELVARDAAVLLAFLGYQTGRPDDVDAGFDRLAELEASLEIQPDVLHELMREVWETE